MKSNVATRRAGFGTLMACVALACAIASPASLGDARDQAKRMHDRIAGVPPDEITLSAMATRIGNNDEVGAALLATDAPEFYNVTLKNFAAPWTNRDRSVFVPLNDYIATIIGMVRDNWDFREILTADVLYIGSGNGIPAYSNTSNAHYEALENTGTDLSANLQFSPQSAVTGVPSTATAGVLTTRAAAKAFFIAGTNRAMFRFTLLNHMCNDLEQVMDTSRIPDRIRQDVSRSPGGDSRLFLNNCIGCHSGMDPLAGAFAFYNYVYDPTTDPDGNNGRIVYDSSQVAAKYFNNSNNFEHGFITTDDTWFNYWRNGPNQLFGWDAQLSGAGSGAKSMGEELSHSDVFAQCQVKKVFENVCLHPVEDTADRAQIAAMLGSFRSSNYNLKQVYAESAVYCMGD